MNYKAFKPYASFALIYGFSRKILHTHNASVKSYNMDFNAQKMPMLFTQRLSVIGIGGLISAVCLPLYVMDDMKELEVWIRGIDPVSYDIDKPKYIWEFVMK